MPRKPRFNLPGIPQHIIQRGNNREPCFFHASDYRRYLEDLKEAAVHYDCRVHAYALMTNHVHLLVTPMQDQAIPGMMQSLGRRYVYYINNRYDRSGTLWQGRYKSSLIDSQHYLLNCMQYIELNPVRAGYVELPGDYTWSSYHANALGHDDTVATYHPVYSALGATASERQDAYRRLLNRPVDKTTMKMIRDALNHELVLGSNYFKDRIEKITLRQTRPGRPGRPRVREEQAIYVI